MTDNENSQDGENPEGESILIAEDNEQVRMLAEIVLTQNGYHVITAENGLKALDLFLSGDHKVQLLLTDLNMPGLNGTELYDRLKESDQKMRVIYMSGYPDDILSNETARDSCVFFVQKPFTIESLLSKVRDALNC